MIWLIVGYYTSIPKHSYELFAVPVFEFFETFSSYYTLNSLSLFWLAESVWWIFEVSAYDVISANYSIIMSRLMSSSCSLCCLHTVTEEAKTWLSFFRSIYNKTIIRFGFCDIQNNQGLGKDYQPQPAASVDNPYLDLAYSGYHKSLIQ